MSEVERMDSMSSEPEPPGRRPYPLCVLARNIAIASLAAGAVLALAACTGDPAAELRRHTYPPEFNYIPPAKLKSTMWQLAQQVSELDRLVNEVPDGEAPPKERIASVLDAMAQSAHGLGSGWPSNHPRITRSAELLQRDIQRARRGLQFAPPNYFWAGSLSGACLYCHGSKL